MAINNSKIEWDEVDEVANTSIKHDGITIKYKILKFPKDESTTDKDKFHYQRVILEPFYAKSAWTKTKPANVSTWIKAFFNSKIKSKHNDIRLRDLKNNKHFEELSTIAEFNGNIDEKIINELYHNEYTKEFKGKKIGNIWKEFEALKKIEPKKSTPEDLTSKSGIIKEECHRKMIIEAECNYCAITIEEINKLASNGKLYTKRGRGYTMEIDQINPFRGYKEDNCAACCYWCNNAKTDEFLIEEFKEIARGINCIWKARGAEIKKFSQIEYWKTQKELKCPKQ